MACATQMDACICLGFITSMPKQLITYIHGKKVSCSERLIGHFGMQLILAQIELSLQTFGKKACQTIAPTSAYPP